MRENGLFEKRNLIKTMKSPNAKSKYVEKAKRENKQNIIIFNRLGFERFVRMR